MDEKRSWLEVAIAGRVDLRWADLRGANLSGIVLRETDLRWANLREANLRGADLRGADLEGADLREVNLREANLREANLRWANLRWANIAGCSFTFPLCRMDFGGWSICIRADETSIGCVTRDNAFWLKATDDDIVVFAPEALTWWGKYGSVVCAAIEAVQEDN